ncbi:hypothetical protein N7470_008325 [Penicillium chermesinum]|nr:hypothetical protein N7470_008325 [Penicillium chermesinum]
METESHPAPESEFSHSPWLEMGHFTSPQHSPPVPEYNGFEFGHPPIMTVDASYGMSLPPPYASMPLPMPTHSWPSLLTQQSPFHENGIPPTPPLPQSVSPSAPVPPDRRQMCLYHQEHQTAKQTDIGALFGVERSTVSKVLRQKDKYLNPEDGSRSPIKRAKGKVPDIEKALSNWLRNYQGKGLPINDEMIREKALFFASNCGCPDGKQKVLTAAWLEKFKQRNGLLGAKARKGSLDARRGSGSISPTHIITDHANGARQSPSRRSSVSPQNGIGSPISPTHSDGGGKRDLPELAGGYQQIHTKSTTPLDTGSTGMVSPTSTLVSESPFTPTSQTRALSGSNLSRPRSQTFPLVPIDPTLVTADDSMDHQSDNHNVAILESPLEFGDEDSHVAKDNDPRKFIKRNRSNPEIKSKSMQPPASVTKSSVSSPVLGPGSPTQDEARHAFETVIKYFERQPTSLTAQEYMTMGKLMERLELAKNQQNAVGAGLPRIDEHDDVPRVNKKRSIHSLG